MPRIDADCEWASVLSFGGGVSPGPLERSGDSLVMRFDPWNAAHVRVLVKVLQAPEVVLARDVVRLPSDRQVGDAVQIRAIKLTADGEARLHAAEQVPVLVSLANRLVRLPDALPHSRSRRLSVAKVSQ